MSDNIRLTRDEMNNVLRNMAHRSQSTIDARRRFFDEIADLNIYRGPDGASIDASCIDFQGLDETLSRQKQHTNAIKFEIGTNIIGKNMQGVFFTRKSSGTNPTRIVDGKPDYDKPPFSTEESTLFAA